MCRKGGPAGVALSTDTGRQLMGLSGVCIWNHLELFSLFRIAPSTSFMDLHDGHTAWSLGCDFIALDRALSRLILSLRG